LAYRIGIDARKLKEPGTGDYIQQLVRGLAEIDADNTYILFTGGQYDDEFEDLPERFVTVTERSPVFSLRERLALSWRQLRERLDLYHATHYILPLWLPRRTVTTVYDIVDLLYPDFMPGRLSKYVAPAQIRVTLSRSDRLVAGSDNTKSDLVDYFDLSARKIERIYPGIDQRFSALSEDTDRQVLTELGLEGEYVLFRGDPRPHKNEELVLRAFAAATRGSGSAVRLVGIGDRELSPERFEYLLGALELKERTHWFDADVETHLPALLRGARLFVYPTLYEGLALPVVEAMACGVPVVASRNATLCEMAENSAKLVEPSSLESLAGAIGWCLNDKRLASHLAADGLERSKDFRWRRVAEQTLEVYRSALSNGGGRTLLRARRESPS
jgi:glycosyltransferase involved in cell wall biosynthesis